MLHELRTTKFGFGSTGSSLAAIDVFCMFCRFFFTKTLPPTHRGHDAMCNSATTRGIAKNKNNQNLVASRNGLFAAAAAATKKPRIRQSLVRRMMIINLCDFFEFCPLACCSRRLCLFDSQGLWSGACLSLLLTDWDLFAQWLDFFRALDAASYLTFFC